MRRDPICNYVKKNRWQGVLVEPVPYLFEKLKDNYMGFHDRLFFENSAIASESGKLKFYRLQRSNLPDLPEWYDQLGSFKKEVILKHRKIVPFFDDLLMEDTVNAITFKELLDKYSIKKLSLVHIDTEGYDFEIIKMIPFSDLGIDLIMFEHKHLSYPDYKQALRLLQGYGYEAHSVENSGDTIALKKVILYNLTSFSN
jgi:FkbM family methyltransferase